MLEKWRGGKGSQAEVWIESKDAYLSQLEIYSFNEVQKLIEMR
jgi:hypothetical protein